MSGAYIVLVYLSICLWVEAGPGQFNVYEKFRAGQYTEINRRYSRLLPRKKLDRYILARSNEKQKAYAAPAKAGELPANLLKTVQSYLAVAGIFCPGAKTEATLVDCLKKRPRLVLKDHMDKLAILRAARLTRQKKLPLLSFRFLLLADIRKNDPISRNIYCDRLKAYIADGYIEKAVKLTGYYKELESGQTAYCRARVMYRANQSDKSIDYYLKGAEITGSRQVLRDIFRDLRGAYPSLFSPARLKKGSSTSRRMTRFVSLMSKQERQNLSAGLTLDAILAGTNSRRLKDDGLLLLFTSRAGQLESLARKMRPVIEKRPDILYAWLARLNWDRNRDMFFRMVSLFKETRKNHKGVWRLYIKNLEKVNREKYYVELLAFLSKHHADIRAYDRLIKFLIGPGAESRRWASQRHWKMAIEKLPAQTGVGRFAFWLNEYLLAKNQGEAAKKLAGSFYRYAPGSYYAHHFWNDTKGKNYIRDWKKVRNRKTFLNWVSRHGGNDNALRYLSRKRFQSYLDPEAVKLWKEIRKAQYPVPMAIIDLYRIGEYNLGGQYFDQLYKHKLSDVESLAYKSYVGRKAGNLFISVYYTRQLARARHVPEDPFGMPAGLLKELYPRPYLNFARKHGGHYKVPAAMIYALMRQESMFREGATSHSGASGLMQIMPRTGAWLAERLKLKQYDLYNPETSIRLGSMFFADLLRTNEYDFRKASIAYNGGPGNLRKWSKAYYRGKLNHFLEFIPKAESRNYCRITYQNYQHYRATYLLYP